MVAVQVDVLKCSTPVITNRCKLKTKIPHQIEIPPIERFRKQTLKIFSRAQVVLEFMRSSGFVVSTFFKQEPILRGVTINFSATFQYYISVQ